MNRFPSLIYCNGVRSFPSSVSCSHLSNLFLSLVSRIRGTWKYSKLMAYNNVASCDSKLPSESEKKSFVMKHWIGMKLWYFIVLIAESSLIPDLTKIANDSCAEKIHSLRSEQSQNGSRRRLRATISFSLFWFCFISQKIKDLLHKCCKSKTLKGFKFVVAFAVSTIG